MKFKVDDRVKYSSSNGLFLGTVVAIKPDSAYPYFVQWDNGTSCYYSNNADIELIQPETQEPVPGKFYRTREGCKYKFLMKASQAYLYEWEDGGEFYVSEFHGPYRHIAAYETNSDIVGEWTDEVVLPAVEIKRWVLVRSTGSTRGEVLYSNKSKDDVALYRQEWLVDPDIFEIVELTGTLPERKI